jgi:hypothetical protein
MSTCLAPKCDLTSACPTKLIAPVAFLFHDGLFHYLICSTSELLPTNLFPSFLPHLPQTLLRSPQQRFAWRVFREALTTSCLSGSFLAHPFHQLPHVYATLSRIVSQVGRRTRATRWTAHNVLRWFRGLWLQQQHHPVHWLWRIWIN